MSEAFAFLAGLAARIDGQHFRLVLCDGSIAVEFVASGRWSKYGLSTADLDRPVQDLIDEIVAHHRATAGDAVRVAVDNIAAK